MKRQSIKDTSDKGQENPWVLGEMKEDKEIVIELNIT